MYSVNLSTFSNQETATTCKICAIQRAENLAILGIKNVIELCVGPSLKTLEKAYNHFNISVTGNDIDKRWKIYYPKGSWIIGDARKIDVSQFDGVVIAPPLSKNCSGKRLDALSLDEIIPSYYDFLHLKNKTVVYVLPGKTLSIKEDRRQLYKLLKNFSNYELIPLKNKIIKYVDVYVKNF